MARKVNPSVYEAKAVQVKETLGENAIVKYAFNKEGEQHHSLQVIVPFSAGKTMGKERNLSTKAVRKAFPYRFDFESSTIIKGAAAKSLSGGKSEAVHKMKWVCYL